jgi:hypothetical protein
MDNFFPNAELASEPGDTRVNQFETDVVLRDGSLVHVRPVLL